MDLKNKLYFTNIFIIDWDDTLFPTTWVNQNSINLSDEDSIKDYKLYFIELDRTVSTFLENLRKVGQIFIVTNANIKWIKACIAVLTSTRKIIMEADIRIVSARDMYSSTSSSPTEWKIKTFKDILNSIVLRISDKLQCNMFLNIISLGDANYEYAALISLDDYFKSNIKNINYLLKSIKFIEKPRFDIIIDQIMTVKKNAEHIINKIGYIDLKFKD